jgi:acyl-CoA synthetase (AMP-forming)/AMP-acid ligase II
MIWQSRYAPAEVGGTTFHDWIGEAAERHAERVALVDGATGQAVTYAALAERVDRVAALLAGRGFRRGDVLAVQAPNQPAWAGVALAAIRLGGAVTGIPVAATAAEVERQTADAGVSLLLTGDDFTPALLAAADRPPRVETPPDALALLPYSSGTSGLAKGVMITHANLVTAVRQVSAGLRIVPGDAVLALAPFAHVMGFVIALGPALAAGARVVTLPRFDVEGFLATLERERVTVVIVPPPVMRVLARHPRVEAFDLSAVELIVSGGAPLGAALQQEVQDRFPRAAVGQGYGLTESTAIGTMPDRAVGTVPGSAGRLMPNVELRVADDGELLLRGPQTMAGYLGRPDETAAMIDAAGWLRTGDLGHIDAEGNVFVVDRMKELIKVDALQVAPAEVEAVIGEHPAVAECAVVGRPDDRHGEVPVAVVVPRGQLEADELIAFVAERVAPHKRLRAVRFADAALPRTPAGKLLRRLLRDQPSYV